MPTSQPLRAPAPRKDCLQTGRQPGQQLGLSCVHPGAAAEPGGGRATRARRKEPRAPLRVLRGAPQPCELPGGQPTLELGKVSLKKVGSQERRMKKEQAAESWEMMAALGGRGPGSGSRVHTPAPSPHPGQPGA